MVKITRVHFDHSAAGVDILAIMSLCKVQASQCPSCQLLSRTLDIILFHVLTVQVPSLISYSGREEGMGLTTYNQLLPPLL